MKVSVLFGWCDLWNELRTNSPRTKSLRCIDKIPYGRLTAQRNAVCTNYLHSIVITAVSVPPPEYFEAYSERLLVMISAHVFEVSRQWCVSSRLAMFH